VIALGYVKYKLAAAGAELQVGGQARAHHAGARPEDLKSLDQGKISRSV
jgi:hypothetical protein